MSSFRTLKLWSLETRECLQTFVGHRDAVLAVKVRTVINIYYMLIDWGLDAVAKVSPMAGSKCTSNGERRGTWYCSIVNQTFPLLP